MNNNHKNSNCGFSEQLVSYLYGEANSAETAQFERHLPTCSVCADEFEAFAGVKFSVGNWKQNEFANLATPLIEIPYPKTFVEVERNNTENSWLTNLRGLFSKASMNWSMAAASLLILFAGVALFFVFSTPQQSDLIAQNNTKQTISPTPPTADKSPADSNDNVFAPKTPDIKTPKPIIAPKTPSSDVAVKPNPAENRVVKVSNNEPRTPKIIAPNAPKNIETKRNIKFNNEVVPKTNDDGEDKTLRLSEIFDEIGSK